MALVTIYDKEGNAKLKEAVDARECVATGEYFMSPPEVKVEEVVSTPVDIPSPSPDVIVSRRKAGK